MNIAPIMVPGQRVFVAGHSFHTWIAESLPEIADAAGIKNHRSAGVTFLGGSTVLQHWRLPDETNAAKAALRAGNVDVLTVSPIWLPDEGIEQFAIFGLEHNPNLRITVQEFWLPNDAYEPIYPLQTKKQVDHNAANLSELRRQHERYFHDMDQYVRDINQRLGHDAILIVPVGQAVLELREKIIAHQAPGLPTQADLFTDSWGHPKPAIKTLASYCHFAVIYRRNPAGLPVPRVLTPISTDPATLKSLNHLLQDLAWHAVTHHPLTGVTASPAT